MMALPETAVIQSLQMGKACFSDQTLADGFQDVIVIEGAASHSACPFLSVSL